MKDFNRWNELKKKIDSNNDLLDNFPKEGEVWMSSVGLNIGYEQNGSENNFSRPVLIVKKFNNISQLHIYYKRVLSVKLHSFLIFHSCFLNKLSVFGLLNKNYLEKK